jgi:hypothetical protein
LTNLNPEDKSLSYDEFKYYSLGLLTEDMLQLKSTLYLLDLGWYPDSEVHGEYYLRLLPINERNVVDWDAPIYELKTKSLDKILIGIEIITSVLK